MSQENVEIAKEGVAAINHAYRTGDITPWRKQVEKAFDPAVVLEAGTEAFTEGEWRGHEGAVGFVMNQMEVLERMWLRVDEYIDVDEDWLIAPPLSVDRHGTPVPRSRCTRSMSSDCATEGSSGDKSILRSRRH